MATVQPVHFLKVVQHGEPLAPDFDDGDDVPPKNKRYNFLNFPCIFGTAVTVLCIVNCIFSHRIWKFYQKTDHGT